MLLANRKPNDPPILVLCLTNHALDQFLEGVLALGEENVVRVGSRSKSEKLENYNLRKLSMAVQRPRGEGRELWCLREQADALQKRVAQLREQLSNLQPQKRK